MIIRWVSIRRCERLWGDQLSKKKLGVLGGLAGLGWLLYRMSQTDLRVKPTGSMQSGQIAPPLPDIKQTADLYWQFVQKRTLGLVRPHIDQGGVSIKVLGITMIRLGLPTYHIRQGSTVLAWPIQRGLLVAYPGGWFSFCLIHEDAGYSLQLRLSGFRPSLPKPLYRLVEQPLHILLGNRFLGSLAKPQIPTGAGGILDSSNPTADDPANFKKIHLP